MFKIVILALLGLIAAVSLVRAQTPEKSSTATSIKPVIKGGGLEYDVNYIQGLLSTLAGESVGDDVMKVEQRGYSVPITTAATTVLKAGPGWLHNCLILGGTSGTITIYDNTAASGAVIVPTFTPPTGIYALPLDMTFSVGAAVVTGAATTMTCTVR